MQEYGGAGGSTTEGCGGKHENARLIPGGTSVQVFGHWLECPIGLSAGIDKVCFSNLLQAGSAFRCHFLPLLAYSEKCSFPERIFNSNLLLLP